MNEPSQQLPDHRWHFQSVSRQETNEFAEALGLSPTLAQILVNRGLLSSEHVQQFIDPDAVPLPPPAAHFEGLSSCISLLRQCIQQKQKILICGDYDADGMTSTALFLRALRALGADISYSIPSRMQEGYGINRRMVEEAHQAGVSLILTVDNGIAAHEPIALARSLGISVIVTDHHDIPPELPEANVILNPKLLPLESPYRGMAGVGVAYIVADELAQQMGVAEQLRPEILSLFTLGTIADLAPLVGVNRRWVRQGLKILPQSPIEGIQALIQLCGLSNQSQIKPEEIGFRLGPRINAIGRLGDCQIIIDLFTTSDPGRALELAMTCENANKLRQELCEQIEQEAIALCQQQLPILRRNRVIVLVQPDWHHGVIGIVASRLVERFGMPVFIGTFETHDSAKVRGSARGIPEFNVMDALNFAGDTLKKFGGHHAAGGFSLEADQVSAFRQRLSTYAQHHLDPDHLKPLIRIDAHACFEQLGLDLIEELRHLQPCGIENPEPIFWAAQVEVLEQRPIGKGQKHLKLKLRQSGSSTLHDAVAWNWGRYQLPSQIDIAFKLQLNEWQGVETPQLVLVGARLPETVLEAQAQFQQGDRSYVVFCYRNPAYSYLQIRNQDGRSLEVRPDSLTGVLLSPDKLHRPVDVRQPPFSLVVQAALDALEQPHLIHAVSRPDRGLVL